MQNCKLSEALAVLGAINPSSQAAGTANSGWISLANARRVLAIIQVGTFGAAATVDAKIQQAKDLAGTGAKDVAGKSIVQLLAAGGNNVLSLIDVNADELDVNNGYSAVQLSITVGAAATQTAGLVLGGDTRFNPASAFNAASVAAAVG
jgi:hypothetical protein